MAGGGFHTPNHRWVLVSALAQAPEACRVLIALQTPVDWTLEVRCGTWSDATEGILASED